MGQVKAMRDAALPKKVGGYMAGLMQQALTKEQRKDVLEELYGVRTVKAESLTHAHALAMFCLLKPWPEEENSSKLHDFAEQELQAFAEEIAGRKPDEKQGELL